MEASGSREDSAFERTIADTQADPAKSVPSSRGDGIDRLPRGATIGRYVVLETLGAGAMGTVYAAYDPELDRQVALKLLQSDVRDPEGGQARLRREAQALARLSHPNVVGVHDVGEHQGQVFVAMQYVRGATLRAWAKGEHEWPARLEVLIRAGRGLAAAHAAGLVHRDFKPDNVMVQENGEVIVLDFGLARAGDEAGAVPAAPDPATLEASFEEATGGRLNSALDSDLTRTGTILGTPAYMAPEQHTGLPADARCDQFAFGVTAFEVLYGERPFAGRNMAELLINMSSGVMREPPANHPAPNHLRQVILRALSNAPAERWPDMDSLLDALTQEAVGGVRRGLMYGLLAMVPIAVGVSAWVSAPKEEPCRGAAAKVEGVWGPDQRRAVRVALDIAGGGPGARAGSQVEATLDAYTKLWSEQYDQNCRDTRVEGIQSDRLMDLRAACLDRRLDQVQAVATLLSKADPELALHAGETVAQLRPLTACSDEAALLAEVEPPPAEQRASVREIQAELERARVLEFAGKYEDAQSLAQTLVQRAEATGYRPLLGEAKHRLGSTMGWILPMDQAMVPMEAGFHDSLSSGDDDWAARGAADIAFFYAQEQKSTPALEWIRTAESLVERGGRQPETEAWVTNIRGVVNQTAGKREASLIALQRAIELWTELFGADHVYIAAALDNMGGTLLELDRLDEAEDAHSRAKAMLERILGPEHPHIGYSEAALGSVYTAQDDWSKAEPAFRRAIEILSEAQGSDHPLVTGVRIELIEGLLARGDTEAARRALDATPLLRGDENAEDRALLEALRKQVEAPGEPPASP